MSSEDDDADDGSGDGAGDFVPAAGAPRPALQELPRPDGMEAGRLRLVDYPVLEPGFIRVEPMPLELGSYAESIALPLSKVKGKGRKSGAVYTKRGKLVRDSERAYGVKGGIWHSNKRRLPEEEERTTITLPGRSFFLGHWSPGFGHVLLEMLPRLWPRMDYSAYDNFVLYPRRMDATPVMEHSTWLRDLLGLCDIPLEKIVIVRDKAVQMSIIDVTTPPFIIKAAADPRFVDVFERMRTRVLESGAAPPASELPRRVYLSRSKMATRAALNEEEVELAMEQQGFTVLHPQLMTIAEQIAILANAEAIAGCDGSALHMAAFARPGTKLLALDARVVLSQFVIDQARGLDAMHVLAVDEVIHRRAKWSARPAQVSAALDLLLTS